MKNVPTNLNKWKSKVDKLDIGKLETTPVDLSEVSNAVKMMLLKKDVCNTELNKIKDAWYY